MTSAFIFLAVLFLTYSNGANDNFKGVATLFGSRTVDYKFALLWATLTTLAGSLCAVIVAGKLVAAFSGKGLVADSVIGTQAFMIAVSLGAAATVFAATLTGFPVSTTHALTGALVGAGLASAAGVNFIKLWGTFFYPLLLSPLIALTLTILIYPLFKTVRKACGIQSENCVCVDGRDEVVEFSPGGAAVLKSTGLSLTIDQVENCQARYQGSLVGVSVQQILNGLHTLTAGAVCFARGLNDTPKVMALFLMVKLLPAKSAILFVPAVMALGGWLNAKKVALTMSRRITPMNHGQGFTANLVTSALVIFASKWGLPVSTTHVSCGSLFGIGLVTGKAQWNTIGKILLSWLITLPAAAILSGLIFYLARLAS